MIAKFRTNRSLAVGVSLMVALMVLSACGSSKPNASTKATPQAAWSGTWKVDVDFGNATITVNKRGTLVTKISYEFDCGSASSATGSIGATKDNPGWPVDKAGSFAFQGVPMYFNLLDDSSNTTATMSGQFAGGGKSASGEWDLVVNDGTKCSAAWSSVR